MSTKEWKDTKEYFITYSIMINTARHQGLCTYQEIAQAVDFPTTGSFMANQIGSLIGAVSRNEIEHGRPMLSSLVVGVSGVPGEGYYSWAGQLGLFKQGENQEEFWKLECEKIYEEWKAAYRVSTGK